MSKKPRKKTTSCGTLTWRLRGSVPQILLIKQFPTRESWGIPKGHLNDDEALEDCAVRETREETGVHVVVNTRLSDCYASFKDEEKTIVSFLATPLDPLQEPTHDDPNNEVADARWFDIDALPDIHPYQRELVSNTVSHLRRANS